MKRYNNLPKLTFFILKKIFFRNKTYIFNKVCVSFLYLNFLILFQLEKILKFQIIFFFKSYILFKMKIEFQRKNRNFNPPKKDFFLYQK